MAHYSREMQIMCVVHPICFAVSTLEMRYFDLRGNGDYANLSDKQIIQYMFIQDVQRVKSETSAEDIGRHFEQLKQVYSELTACLSLKIPFVPSPPGLPLILD